MKKDLLGLLVVTGASALLILYRHYYIEPRIWGSLCAAADAPLACGPREGLLWLQQQRLWGTAALALGIWAFAFRGRFAVQVAAVVIGVAAVINYNTTWGAVGLALGAWAWLGARSSPADAT